MLCLYIIMCFLPVHRYSVVNFTFSGPLGLLDSTFLFGSRVAFNKGLIVALNPGLGGVRDVAPAIISPAIFKHRMLCFQRISFQIMFRLKIFYFRPPMRFGRLK